MNANYVKIPRNHFILFFKIFHRSGNTNIFQPVSLYPNSDTFFASLLSRVPIAHLSPTFMLFQFIQKKN